MFKKILLISIILGNTVLLTAQSQRRPISVKDTITDKDLMIPEEIERNFDQLLADWRRDMKISAYCTSTNDENVSYPDSSYIRRLYSLPTEMELVYNPVVRSYIEMYTGRMRSSVGFFLAKSNYYFPIFEKALDREGLPLELKYLPIIESALNPTIKSRAGAMGLWQFMIGTAKLYNLEINSLVDERCDPLKSTDAAVRYLKDLYDIYGDWNLVIAAYNCGPGNVNKAIRRSGGKTDYWDIYQYLPRETRGYVPAFIAATYAMNYYSLHNICPAEYEYNHSTDTIVVDRYLHLKQLSEVLNVPLDDLRSLNPQFKKDIVPGEFKKYVVKLPSAQAVDFSVYKENVYAHRSNEFLSHRKVVNPSGMDLSNSDRIRHRVRRGESLSTIASKHRVTVAQLKKWNGLRSTKLRVGQVLSVHKPVRKTKQAEEKQAELLAQNNANKENNVNNELSSQLAKDIENARKDAEAPNMLAEYFNRQAAENSSTPAPAANAESVMIEAAENITAGPSVEEEAHSIPIETRTIYHKVRIGETLTQIGNKYKVSPDDIVDWNKIETTMPRVGERLIIHLPQQTSEPVNNAEERADELMADIAPGNSDPGFEEYRESRPAVTGTGGTNVPAEAVSKPAPAAKKPASKQTTYTVKAGDTLGHIVEKFGKGLTVREIKRVNKLRSDRLKIGQKLKIPR
ncbi:MAG TPA: lytic transglycosylase [Dysgonomonas sp.]|nr:lytic transglycosylase [Dysgonomonas sp.]